MKKVLSIFMTGLLVLLNFSVKGCEVQNLFDGGKKVIYRYNELDDLIKVHDEAKNELELLIKNKTKRHNTIEKNIDTDIIIWHACRNRIVWSRIE